MVRNKLIGNEQEHKAYQFHSGFPGGLKEVSAKRLKAQQRADGFVRDAGRRHAAEGLKRHSGQKPQPLAP